MTMFGPAQTGLGVHITMRSGSDRHACSSDVAKPALAISVSVDSNDRENEMSQPIERIASAMHYLRRLNLEESDARHRRATPTPQSADRAQELQSNPPKPSLGLTRRFSTLAAERCSG